jgi:hypothetical protein
MYPFAILVSIYKNTTTNAQPAIDGTFQINYIHPINIFAKDVTSMYVISAIICQSPLPVASPMFIWSESLTQTALPNYMTVKNLTMFMSSVNNLTVLEDSAPTVIATPLAFSTKNPKL